MQDAAHKMQHAKYRKVKALRDDAYLKALNAKNSAEFSLSAEE